jgi:maleate isomerase
MIRRGLKPPSEERVGRPMESTVRRAGTGTTAGLGLLSGRPIVIPDVNAAPMPSLGGTGVILNGQPAEGFGTIGSDCGYPDVLSYRRKFGLLVPATNTTMEAELWRLICANPALEGVGLHTANVMTPRPKFGTAEELAAYQRDFLAGLRLAVEQVQLAEPQYLIMGMSLEHILAGLGPINAAMDDIAALTTLAWSTWQDAAAAALHKVGARRIGLLTPFEATGNRNAEAMFADLGFDVAASVGFCCAFALHIAHIPDWAKEKAILELLATADNRLDAIVQCGTNMSLSQVSARLEPRIGIPIIGINGALLWHALRENGIGAPIHGGSLLLRDF